MSASHLLPETYTAPLNAFFSWSEKEIFNKTPTSTKQGIFSSIGFIIGAISAYVMYPLGEGFGGILANLIHVQNAAGQKALRIFFGAGALIPMIALGGIATQDQFTALAAKPLPENDIIHYSKWKNLKRYLIKAAYCLGLFSAIPQSSLTIEYLSNSRWKFIITPAAVIGPFLFNSGAVLALIDRTFNMLNRGDTEELRKQRVLIQNCLQNAIESIKKLDEPRFIALLSQLFNEDSSFIRRADSDGSTTPLLANHSTSSITTKERIRTLFSLGQATENENMPEEPKTIRYGRYFLGGLSFLVGAVSAYPYYFLAQQATIKFCQIVGLHAAYNFSSLLGVLAYIPNAALAAIRTQEGCERFYDKCFSSKKSADFLSYPTMRQAASGIASFAGAMSATPLTYIQIENAIQSPKLLQKLLVAPTFLGPFFIRADALNRLHQRGIDTACHTFFPEETAVKRDQLCQAMQTLIKKISILSDECISAIYNQFMQNNISYREEINTVSINTYSPG